MSVIFSIDINGALRKRAPESRSSEKNGIFLKGDKGVTVILIHGLTGTPNEMKFLATYLNKKGYSVACPRLAYHGEPLWSIKNAKWQDFYGSVRQALLEEVASGSNGPIFTAGLSMGALLALLLADEFKDRVCGVSCLAPTLFYDGWNTPASSFFLPLGYRTFLKHFFYYKEEPPYGIKNEVIRSRVHKYYSNARLGDMESVEQYGYPYFPITLLYQLQLLVRYLTKRLGGIRVPAQLIQAKDDDVASVKNSKFIYDRIGSEMKEMVLLYNSTMSLPRTMNVIPWRRRWRIFSAV
ncbi:MAG: alpha/beta fold hydrolase [Candidatus Omnitrophota bacterium]